MSDKKLFETDLDKPMTSMNNLKVNAVTVETYSSGKSQLRVSLSGGGMDFYIGSEYTGSMSYGEVNDVLEPFEEEVQELINAYLEILKGKMIQIDQVLRKKELEKNGS